MSSQMGKVKVKKLWLGHASVRDYVVKKAIANKEDIVIECNGTSKTFPYRSLKTYLMNTTNEPHKSKFNNQTYTLIDFPWGKASW